MQGMVLAPEMFLQIVDLGMTIMTGRNAIIRAGIHDLFEFKPAIIPAGVGEPGLEKPAPAAATEIVGAVGLHINEIFLAHHRPDDKSEIFRNGIPQGFADKLARILHRELDFQIPVPV